MKLSCIPICLFGDIRSGKMSAYEWYEMAARLGLDGIEMYDDYLPQQDEPTWRAEAERVRSLGLEVSMFTGYGDVTNPDPAGWQTGVDQIKQSVDAALAFDTSIVRVVAGACYDSISREDHIANAARGLSVALDYAVPRGISLAFEDHPRFGTRIEDFVAVIDRVNRPELKVNLDTSNPMESGQNAADLVGLVKDRVVHVHASDRDADLAHTVTGECVVDFPTIFRVLKHEALFDGWVSPEAGGTRGESGIRDGLEYVRRTWGEA